MLSEDGVELLRGVISFLKDQTEAETRRTEFWKDQYDRATGKALELALRLEQQQHAAREALTEHQHEIFSLNEKVRSYRKRSREVEGLIVEPMAPRKAKLDGMRRSLSREYFSEKK
jgi:hypothetical protein